MRTEQRKWTKDAGWSGGGPSLPQADLALVFGAVDLLRKPEVFKELKGFHPEARLLMCSTAGEIHGVEVSDGALSYTAVKFDSTKLEFAAVDIAAADDSLEAGKKLSAALPKNGLVHAMVFSDGLKVNGTPLVEGLLQELRPLNVSVTGGLVGDGGAFKETVIGLDEQPRSGRIVLIGFYGPKLRVGYGSMGGWDPFGLDRKITRSRANILYELDGKPALKLYKEYLGDQAKDLPGSGLLFPLSLRLNQDGEGEVEVVRTLLAVNEADQSLTFAGDMPEGATVKLMKANFDRLIDGAGGAATMSLTGLQSEKPELAILISCIGRKLVLKERIEEETEAVRSIIGDQAAMAGFYSYGEICPVTPLEKQCRLHNQTMTITVFKEV